MGIIELRVAFFYGNRTTASCRRRRNDTHPADWDPKRLRASGRGGETVMCKSYGHRGFVAAWPQFGSPAGLFLANLAVLAFSRMSGEAFLTWGWHIPFLLSLLLVIVGLYIRLGILDTPIFTKLVAEKKIERTPILQVIRTQPRPPQDHWPYALTLQLSQPSAPICGVPQSAFRPARHRRR
jgi:MFS family permease